jgi:hypothetical protein
MSLDFDFSRCADPAALRADTEDGWPVTDCTIWLCLIVGIDTITEQNAEAFWHRVYAWETITGPLNTSGRRMEPADIRNRIGLRTNASRLTDAAWRKKLAATMHDDSAAAWRRTDAGRMTRDEIEQKERSA